MKFQPRLARSFYLTLRIAPRQIRQQVTLAYFIARAADTIADTGAVRGSERFRCLGELKKCLTEEKFSTKPVEAIASRISSVQTTRLEKDLINDLPALLAAHHQLAAPDRERANRLLGTLMDGMLFDLTRFPPDSRDNPGALESREELRHYAYMVAGVVGEYWTEMLAAHFPILTSLDLAEMTRLGVALGRGLQLINILRDLPRDLANGRCYLPANDLARAGLSPAELLKPECQRRVKPLFLEIARLAESELGSGIGYLRFIPSLMIRNRLAVALPMLIGAATLRELRTIANPLDPRQVTKITRSEVYRILLLSLATAPSNRGIASLYRLLKG